MAEVELRQIVGRGLISSPFLYAATFTIGVRRLKACVMAIISPGVKSPNLEAFGARDFRARVKRNAPMPRADAARRAL
jgi:hypothetical protein